MSFGIGWNGPAPSLEWGSLLESDRGEISVPEVTVPSPHNLNMVVSHLIDPLRESPNHGIDLYERALEVSLSFDGMHNNQSS